MTITDATEDALRLCGPDATECPACKHKTVHQHTHLCQTPGCALGEYKEKS